MIFYVNQISLHNPIKRSHPILTVAISPDGKYTLSSGIDFVLRKWDLNSRTCTHSWQAGGPLNAITIHPNSEWSLISTVMGALLWDLNRWQFIRSYLTNRRGTYDIAHSEMLGMAIGAGEDSLIYRWDLESGEKYKPLTAHQYPVSALVVSNGSNLLLSGDSNGEIYLWELTSGESISNWKGQDNQNSDLAILPRSRRLLSASQEPRIKVWDLYSGEYLQEMSADKGWIHALAVSKQENCMLSAGEDGLRIWDLEHNSNLDADDSEDISCLALSANDKLAISGSRAGSLSIWNIQPADQEDR